MEKPTEGLEDGRLLMEKVFGANRKTKKETQKTPNAYNVLVQTGPKQDLNARKALTKAVENGHIVTD